MTELMADEKATTKDVRTTNKHRQIWPGITRRGVQVTLGVLCLVDAALQMQPYMFTAAFARQVLAPCRSGPARLGCWPSRLLRPSHRRAPRIAEHSLRADPTRPGHRVLSLTTGPTRDPWVPAMVSCAVVAQ